MALSNGLREAKWQKNLFYNLERDQTESILIKYDITNMIKMS